MKNEFELHLNSNAILTKVHISLALMLILAYVNSLLQIKLYCCTYKSTTDSTLQCCKLLPLGDSMKIHVLDIWVMTLYHNPDFRYLN